MAVIELELRTEALGVHGDAARMQFRISVARDARLTNDRAEVNSQSRRVPRGRETPESSLGAKTT